MKKSKTWYKSSTVWLNIVAVLVVALKFALNSNLIPDPDVIAVITAVLNILNRFRTTQPVTLK